MKRFTSIELLVVVAITGILTSMLIPAIAKVNAESRSTVCLSNTKQSNTIIQISLQDQDYKYICPWNRHGVDPLGNHQWRQLWSEHLQSYDLDWEITSCIDSPSSDGWAAYGSRYTPENSMDLASIDSPASYWLLADTAIMSSGTLSPSFRLTEGFSSWLSSIHFRHNERSNVSFLDGHSKKLHKDNTKQYGLNGGYSQNGLRIYFP